MSEDLQGGEQLATRPRFAPTLKAQRRQSVDDRDIAKGGTKVAFHPPDGRKDRGGYAIACAGSLGWAPILLKFVAAQGDALRRDGTFMVIA